MKSTLCFVLVGLLIISMMSASIIFADDSAFVKQYNYDIADYVDIIYQNGRYTAACNLDEGFVKYSEDLRDWKAIKVSDDRLNSIVFYEGYYYTMDNSSIIYKSKDLMHWTAMKKYKDTGLRKLAVLGDMLTAYGDNSMIVRSKDGVSWTKVMIKSIKSLKESVDTAWIKWSAYHEANLNKLKIDKIVYYNKTYVMISKYGSGSCLYISKDLSNWQQVYYKTRRFIEDVIYNDGFVAYGYITNWDKLTAYYYQEEDLVLTSKDGKTWGQQEFGKCGGFKSLLHLNSKYYGLTRVNDLIPLVSPDETQKRDSDFYIYNVDNDMTCTKSDTGDSNIRRLKHINKQLIAFGDNGALYQMSEGETLTKLSGYEFIGKHKKAILDLNNNRFITYDIDNNSLNAIYFNGDVQRLVELDKYVCFHLVTSLDNRIMVIAYFGGYLIGSEHSIENIYFVDDEDKAAQIKEGYSKAYSKNIQEPEGAIIIYDNSLNRTVVTKDGRVLTLGMEGVWEDTGKRVDAKAFAKNPWLALEYNDGTVYGLTKDYVVVQIK